MYCVRTVTPDVFLLGASDRRLSLFENVFPVPRESLTTPIWCWTRRPSWWTR